MAAAGRDGWLVVHGAHPPWLLAGGWSAPTGGDAGSRSGPAVEGSRAPAGRPKGTGVPDRREERTALDLEGSGCYPPSCQQIGRAGWGQVPSRQRSGEADGRPARTRATVRIGQRDGRCERLAGAVDQANSKGCGMSNLVGVVALVLALGLGALLVVRRRASRRT